MLLSWFEKHRLRRIFEPKMEEARQDWSKIRNEECHDLYSSPDIINVIKQAEWVGRTRGMCGGEERCIQGCGGET